MPCRCCGTAPRPAKGFDANDDETMINMHLSMAAKRINEKQRDFEDIEDWRKAWIEAFHHHIYGCPEKKTQIEEFPTETFNFKEFDPRNGKMPSDGQECLVVTKEGNVWHCYFDSYTDCYASPPYCFRTIFEFVPFGRIELKYEVAAYMPCELIKVSNGLA